MHRINKLTLKNFKFFYGKVDLNFERKNVLIYGENGSGKSTIYWALYTFLQSVFKTDVREIKKYFDPKSGHENLVNRFAHGNSLGAITVEFMDESGITTVRTISNTIIDTQVGSLVEEAAQSSDFITYKLLAKLYDFKNSQDIDLFRVFEDEILMFITFRQILVRHDGASGNQNALKWWEYIKRGLDPKPKPRKATRDAFQTAVETFNDELASYLYRITETANEYLERFKLDVKLKFNYVNAEYDRFIVPPKIILDATFRHTKLRGNKQNIQRPQSFLNEAKLTAIALAIRFAVFDEKPGGASLVAPKLLILDDLLLSLDMSNRDTVLDAVLSRFTDTQLIVMTHDKLFHELTKHKIEQVARNEWKYLEIYEHIEKEIPLPVVTESKTYLEKAEKYLHQHEYEVAGNFLRKEAEAFCKSFLPKRLHYAKEYSPLNLYGLIKGCAEYAGSNGLDRSLFDDLNRHREFVLNATSHDSYDVPKFKSEVANCLDLMKRIGKIKSETVLRSGDTVEFELTTSSGADTYKFEIHIEDEFKLIKDDGKDSILASGMINYYVYKNGARGDKQHGKESLEKMYEKNYAQSDKVKSADFWEEIIIKSNGSKLTTIRNF
jgi:energy-coupling factor transporter ATP-binding protein EcfA2